MNPQDIENKIQEVMSSFVNFAVPQHRHTGVDSLQIYMGDLLLDSRGLNFPTPSGTITFNSINTAAVNETGILISTSNPNAIFSVGGGLAGAPSFYDIKFEANNSIDSFIVVGGIGVNETNLTATDFTGTVTTGGQTSSFDFAADSMSWSSSGPFELILPTTAQPPAVAGGIYFDGTHFYGCIDGTNWVIII